MTSIRFEEIYSRFFLKTEANDLFSSSLPEEIRNELLCGYVHIAIADPVVRKLFSSIWISDPHIGENDSGKIRIDGLLEYEMEEASSDEEDKEFVLDVISDGMVLAWIDPKLNSIKNISQLISDSDKKFYAQSTHIQANRDLRLDIRLHRDKLISDRDFIDNEYLKGNISNVRED